MTISAYLTEIAGVLRSSAAMHSYFPFDKELRKERNLKLGRELGYGMACCDAEDLDFYLGGLYGRLIVAHSFDSTGVVLDNKEWIKAVKEGIKKRQDQEEPRDRHD